MPVEALAATGMDEPLSFLKWLSATGALGVLGYFFWSLSRGTYRHEREIRSLEDIHKRELAAKDEQLDKADAMIARLEAALTASNQQVISLLETGKRNQQIAERSMAVMENVTDAAKLSAAAPGSQQGRS